MDRGLVAPVPSSTISYKSWLGGRWDRYSEHDANQFSWEQMARFVGGLEGFGHNQVWKVGMYERAKAGVSTRPPPMAPLQLGLSGTRMGEGQTSA